jgi:uncharacterized protein YndB with AHSA1/START domain
MATQTLPTLSQTVQAPVNRVFEAFTTATRLCEWLCDDAQLEAKTGGRFYAYWREEDFYAMGEYLQLKTNEALSLMWIDKEHSAPTQVHIAFSEEHGQTEVNVHHEGGMSEALKRLWQRGLAVLASTQESGYPLEILERPMLGVLIGGDITEENAAQYGVPVNHGVVIQGTVPGLSAEQAGLKHGDVIVAMAGQEVPKWEAMRGIMGQQKAGHTIEVEYYRGAQRHRAKMTLQPRKLHPYPATPAELAEQLAPERKLLEDELEAVFVGVSEAEAAKRPTPTKWSANENLAHLILGERDHQAFLASLVQGHELEAFTANLDARLASVMALNPSPKTLIQAFKAAQTETIELIKALPLDFLERKASVVRFQLAAEVGPGHTRHHFEQMKRAIEAARGLSR